MWLLRLAPLCVVSFVVTGCDPGVAPPPSAPPTFNNEPILPAPPTGGGGTPLMGVGCCLVGVACTEPDASGVAWADLGRRIPCWSTCNAEVEGVKREGYQLRDVREGSPARTLDGIAMERVCSK
jgi:hypothetical protein